MNRTLVSGRPWGLWSTAGGSRVASKELTAPRPAAGAMRTLGPGFRFWSAEGAKAVRCRAVSPSDEREVLIGRDSRLPERHNPSVD